MDARNGSEFAALAARLDELSEVCARLSRENADLRAEVSQLKSGSVRPAGRVRAGAAGPAEQRVRERDGKVSRRMMGKALGAAAAGVVGAVALSDVVAGPAAASDGISFIDGVTNTAEMATTLKYDGSGDPGMVFLASDSADVATGASFPAALGGWAGVGNVANGIYGFTSIDGGSGVVGISTSGASDVSAIIGILDTTAAGGFSAGVKGQNNGVSGDGIGVWGSQAGQGWGVYGDSNGGIGVKAVGGVGTGVDASGNTGLSVEGFVTGASISGPTAVEARGGPLGMHVSGQTAVQAIGVTVGIATSGSGMGVQAAGGNIGVRGSGGRGGVFSGHAAQVQLVPGPTSSHPGSGSRGDLYADKNGRLWFCKKTGNPAVWHQIA
jgi:hypothetical protein